QPFDRGLIATDEGVYVHDARRYFGESWSHTGARKTVAGVVGQRTVAPWLTLRASGRYSDARVQDHHAVDLQGVDDDGRTVRRRITNRVEDSNDLNLRLDAIVDATTGTLDHRLLAGVEYTSAEMAFDSARANIGPLDLYAPVYGATPVPAARPNASYVYDADMRSAYLQDQLALSERWKALVSLRYDAVETTQHDSLNDTLLRTDDRELSMRGGLVFQPDARTSLYASYTESFQPQQGQTRDGLPLSPERGQQIEIGAKLELVPERLALTTAVFQITKQDVATEDPTDPDFSVLTGEQRVRGFEVDITGEIARHWRLLANVSLLDPEITRDNLHAIGNRLVGVPRYSGRLWLHHDFQDLLPGFKLGGGVTVVGARQVDLDNSFDIAGYTTLDATASYAFNDRLELSLRASNLTDRFFVEGVQASNNLYPGMPRAYALLLRARF
ncbi:MAG: TonB-dependent receptor, partial [Pseudoxanthomonas sp.]